MSREMKDSGIEWIGKVPSKWKIDKLSRLTTSYSGGTPSRNVKEFWENGAIPWMSSGEVNKGIVYDTEEKITELGYHNSSAKKFPCKTVVVALNGQGKTKGMSAILMIETTVNQSLVGFICNEDKLHYRYLDYCFKASYYYNRSVIAGGNKRDGIAAESLRQSRVPVPPISIQMRITDIIDAKFSLLDDLIEKTKSTIEDYKLLKQSIITEAVTKGLDKNVEMKDSGIEWIGEIPKQWSVIKLKYCGVLSANGVDKKVRPEEKLYKSVHYMDVYRGSLKTLTVRDDYLVVSADDNKAASAELITGDILLTNSSETPEDMGHSTLIGDNFKKILQGYHLMRFRPTINSNGNYLKFFLGSFYSRNWFSYRSTGITRYGITKDGFADLKILLPPVKEQEEIGKKLERTCLSLDKIIEKKESLIVELQSYKKSLIYEYVTGKKEVR